MNFLTISQVALWNFTGDSTWSMCVIDKNDTQGDYRAHLESRSRLTPGHSVFIKSLYFRLKIMDIQNSMCAFYFNFWWNQTVERNNKNKISSGHFYLYSDFWNISVDGFVNRKIKVDMWCVYIWHLDIQLLLGDPYSQVVKDALNCFAVG